MAGARNFEGQPTVGSEHRHFAVRAGAVCARRRVTCRDGYQEEAGRVPARGFPREHRHPSAVSGRYDLGRRLSHGLFQEIEKRVPRRRELGAGYRQPRCGEAGGVHIGRDGARRDASVAPVPDERAQGAHAARAQHARAAKSLRCAGSVREIESQLDAERPAADRIDRRGGGGWIPHRGGAHYAPRGGHLPHVLVGERHAPRLRLPGMAQIVVRQAFSALQGRVGAPADALRRHGARLQRHVLPPRRITRGRRTQQIVIIMYHHHITNENDVTAKSHWKVTPGAAAVPRLR